MLKERLGKIGGMLGVSGKDISNIKKEYWKNYFLYIGAAIAVGAIFFVLGCTNGANNAVNNAVVNNGGYPFGLVLPGVAAKKRNRIVLGLLGITAFLILMATPVFGEAIKYNVFRKRC